VSVRDFLDLDDARMLTAFAAWEEARDPVLADLASRLRSRSLPKTVPLPEADPAAWEEARARASEVVEGHGMRANLRVFLDVPSDVPYPEPEDDSPRGLWVVLRHRPIQRLGAASFLLGNLRNKRIQRPRLIFPAELRTEVLDAIGAVIG